MHATWFEKFTKEQETFSYDLATGRHTMSDPEDYRNRTCPQNVKCIYLLKGEFSFQTYFSPGF